MRNYQLVLLLKSDLKREQKDKLFEEIKKMFENALTQKVDSIGERKLSYPIKRERKGEYVILNVEAEKVTSDLNKALLIREEILRHLLIRN